MITWQNESALPALFFTATVKSAERATVETLTMPLGKKRKRMGFVGTLAWKKRKVDESSQSSCSLPCWQDSPELSTATHQDKPVTLLLVIIVPLTGRYLVKTVIVKMTLNMRWMIPVMNLMVSQQMKIVMPLLLAFD